MYLPAPYPVGPDLIRCPAWAWAHKEKAKPRTSSGETATVERAGYTGCLALAGGALTYG